MNILQIFPGKVWGGAEQYVLDLSMVLAKEGENTILMSRNSKAVLNRMEGVINVKTLPFICSFDIYSAYKLSLIIKNENIEIIHVHDVSFVPMAIIAKQLSSSGVKVILTRHIARTDKVNLLYKRYFKKLYSIIFVSDLARRNWLHANPWMRECSCAVVLNSILDDENSNTSDTSVVSLRKKFNIPLCVPLLVFTGRVRKSKGCAVLIDALSRISYLQFHLVFIGKCKPSDYNIKLYNIAKKKGISDRISFYGFSERVRQLIHEADIGVAPSIVREACHLSPMEFMQAGKSVVTSDNGAQGEYITSGVNGILVPPDNPEKLAKALSFLIENPVERERMGKNAKEYFNSRLDYSRFVCNIRECYS